MSNKKITRDVWMVSSGRRIITGKEAALVMLVKRKLLFLEHDKMI